MLTIFWSATVCAQGKDRMPFIMCKVSGWGKIVISGESDVYREKHELDMTGKVCNVQY